jgi:hypothetical protein
VDNFQSLKPYIIITVVVLLVATIIAAIIYFSTVKQTSPKTNAINGVFSVQGSIPPGSTITLLAREIGNSTSFSTIQTSIPATDLSSWQLPNAKKGQAYEIKAQIQTGGKTIDSNSIIVTAPTFNQVLTFQITATTPTLIPNITLTSTPTPTPISKTITPTPTIPLVPTPPITPAASSSAYASISGTLTFTGQPPLSSRIVILQRNTGTTDYQVAVDNVIPYATGTWTWSQANKNISYDLLAVLKQKQTNGTDTDLATSNGLTVTAPSTTGALTLSYAPTLSAPNPNIWVSCGTFNGNTQNWDAAINFQTITGAASYWVQIGTTDGGTDITNSTINAQSGNSQVISQALKNGTTYYAKYAYAGIPNILGGATQLSPLSSTAQLKCQ